MSDLSALLRLMLVVDDRLPRGPDLAETCAAAEQSGVTAVLMWFGQTSARDLASAARMLRAALSVPLLVRARADVAIAAGAAGVHLEPGDVPVPMVRRIAPRGFVIGASVRSVHDADHGRGADYWGLGPLRLSSPAPDRAGALDPSAVAGLVRRAEGRPCVVMGCARMSDVPGLRQAGAVGVAVAPSTLAAGGL